MAGCMASIGPDIRIIPRSITGSEPSAVDSENTQSRPGHLDAVSGGSCKRAYFAGSRYLSG